MELNNINNKGAWSEIAAALNQNFLKILAELLKYQHVTTISGANFLGYFTSNAVLPNPAEAAWAVAGDLKAVTVYAYYTSDAVPSGFSAGWNALSSLGTYDFTDYSELLTQIEGTETKLSELGQEIRNISERIEGTYNVNIEAGSINYLTGDNMNTSYVYRTGYIPVKNGTYGINIVGNTNYKQTFVVKYKDGVYVGYEFNSTSINVDSTFNQIRLRIDYTAETDIDVLGTTKVEVTAPESLAETVNKNSEKIEKIGASTESFTKEAIGPGSINYETGKDMSAAYVYRTGYIDLYNGIYNVNIQGNGNFVKYYIIKYKNGVYVGYELNSTSINVDSTFNQIRLRIDYTAETDIDVLDTTSILLAYESSAMVQIVSDNIKSVNDIEDYLSTAPLVLPIVSGSINYETGKDMSAAYVYRTGYIPVKNGTYGINIVGNTNYKQTFVVKYKDGVYVGYEFNSTSISVDSTFNQIRLRIDYTAETDIDVLGTTKVEVLNKDNLFSQLNAQYVQVKGNPFFYHERIEMPYIGYVNLSAGEFYPTEGFLTSDYIMVYPGQHLSIALAGYGNCGISGYIDNLGNGFKVVHREIDSQAKIKIVDVDVPEGVNYIRVSNVKSVLDYTYIMYSQSFNLDYLMRLINPYFNIDDKLGGYPIMKLYQLLTSGLVNDYHGFRLNFNIPNDSDKIYLSTDIYNATFRSEGISDSEIIRALTPYLYYKMKKVGCFVLYDIDNENRPYILDVDGNKKYISFVN